VYAFKENLNLYMMPSQVAENPPPVGEQFRAGGCVVPGSLKKVPNSLTKNFIVTDGIKRLNVVTEQILPDLFAEGESTVLTGKLNGQGEFVATEVLAKHDENYMPPEVAAGLHGGEGPVKSCDIASIY
jgi:cytochrome c-type biogenesis protein CcmE